MTRIPVSAAERPSQTGRSRAPGRWVGLVAGMACLLLSTPVLSATPLADIQHIAAGARHACALTQSGAVSCWGSNQYGQLGDDTLQTRYEPVRVQGLSSGVQAISAGDAFSCALMDDGSVRCWGRNTWGQLGDGSTMQRRAPVVVQGLTGPVQKLQAGGAHACALLADASVRCWGYNDYGQLGTGNFQHQSQAVAVSSGQNISDLSAGFFHNCMIRNSGAVSCWGVYNRSCNLTGCLFEANTLPTNVAGLGSGVQRVRSGQFHNCALLDGGAVRCWGDNYEGQLGPIGTNNPNPFTLFPIEGLQSSVIDLGLGHRSSCARLSGGEARCWGDNTFGQLGDGTNEYGYPPRAPLQLASVLQIEVGDRYACALNSQNQAWCWGSNATGQLGDGVSNFRTEPALVPGLSAVARLSVGDFHSCAITSSGSLRCWGANAHGQIGDGSTIERPTPVTVGLLGGGAALRVGAGSNHTCAVSSAGAAQCWGRNFRGQLGDGSTSDRSSPTAVNTLSSGVSDISAGGDHSCARTAAGGARCWGSNFAGELGNFGPLVQTSPVTPVGLNSGVNAITAGTSHSCALTGTGQIQCWGYNDAGQVGDGSTQDAPSPVTLDLPASGTTAIASGALHTCVLAANGQPWCWGSGADGRLGMGFSGSMQTTPAPLGALPSGASWIAAGGAHSCAVGAGGAAYCWGRNDAGQLGDGGFTHRNLPVPVSSLSSGMQQIGSGVSHSCALSSTGAVYCWGSNSSGQLGIGRRDQRIPAPVIANDRIFADRFE